MILNTRFELTNDDDDLFDGSWSDGFLLSLLYNWDKSRASPVFFPAAMENVQREVLWVADISW